MTRKIRHYAQHTLIFALGVYCPQTIVTYNAYNEDFKENNAVPYVSIDRSVRNKTVDSVENPYFDPC